MDTKEQAHLIAKALSSKKGLDVEVIKISDVSVLADSMKSFILVTKAPFFDDVMYLVTAGTAIANNTPRITITANNSTNVKPFLFILSPPYFTMIILAYFVIFSQY